jgi:hypothetical protein
MIQSRWRMLWVPSTADDSTGYPSPISLSFILSHASSLLAQHAIYQTHSCPLNTQSIDSPALHTHPKIIQLHVDQPLHADLAPYKRRQADLSSHQSQAGSSGRVQKGVSPPLCCVPCVG